MSANLEGTLVALETGVERPPVLDNAARIAAGSGARLRPFCCSHDPRLAEAIVGSTAERLLERTSCDLLVVRGPLA
jgi:nucleotide-binding universal stress UspA family protein